MAEIFNKTLKKSTNEETFFLLDLLKNGSCIRCINKSCKINEEHCKPFPERISTFVQNPTYITGMSKAIENASLDFNGKKPFYTVCNYVNKRCRNCEEGRIKHIIFEDKKIIMCYPILIENKPKVTIGIHINIKLIMKGYKYEVSFIPIELTSKVEQETKFSNIQSIPLIETPVLEQWPSLSEEINIPLQSDKNISEKNEGIKDFSHIKKIHEKNDEIIEEIQKKEEEVVQIPVTKKENENEERLYARIKHLNNEINNLKEQLFETNKNLERSNLINKNGTIYEEILYNIDEINNRVTEQFLNTNYSDYIVY